MENAITIVKLKSPKGEVTDYFLKDVTASNLFGTLTHSEGDIHDTTRFRALSIFYPLKGDVYGVSESRYDHTACFYALFETPIRVSALGTVTSMVLRISGDAVNQVVWDKSSTVM